MSNHPALQPRLARADVQALIGYLAAARDEHNPLPDHISEPWARGRRAGINRAIEIVSDLWAAQVIAVEAVNKVTLADALEAAIAEDDDDD